jgi:hypothetical protein
MTRYLTCTLVLSVGLTAAACGGGSNLDPGAGDDPGAGTSTLMVDGTAHASPRISNAQGRGDFDTSFSVRVQQNGQDVTTATVEVTSSSGTVVLALGEENRYVGTAAGYDEVFVLDVENGADFAHDIRVDGPAIHTFSKPLAGATVDASLPLDIAWKAGEAADSAELHTDELDDIAMPDNGSYTLAALALKTESDKPRTNQLRIRRANRVTPAQTIGGSEWTVSVDNRIEVVAMPLAR